MNRSSKTIIKRVVLLAAIAALAAPAFAITYNLQAGVTTVTIGSASVPMWGFGLAGQPITVPGPILTVPPGDTTLIIQLQNNLPKGTSIVIPGLQRQLVPQRTPDAQGRQRMRSFVPEIPAGQTGVYSFTGVKPGTYLYHSGTHSAVQVQMGLYGAVKADAAAGVAYPAVNGTPAIAYQREQILVFSEIDPALHQAVNTNTYGTSAYPSTINYVPRYFLINGKSHVPGTPPVNVAQVNQALLVRMLNAGLSSRVPMLNGAYMNFVAEDGNPYPYAKQLYAVEMPPLKTMDAIWVPTAAATYKLFDRRLGLTTNGANGGGMLIDLAVTTAGNAPVAVDDSGTTYRIAEDSATPLSIAAPGVLANDTPATGLQAVLVNTTPGGTLALNADGSLSYSPRLNFNGTDYFTYKAREPVSGLESNLATVRITVTAVNDAPVAVNDPGNKTAPGVPVTVSVLANDTDVDGNALTVREPLDPTLMNPVGAGTIAVTADKKAIVFTPAAGTLGNVTFRYRAWDGLRQSNLATVTVNVAVPPNQPPVALDDTGATTQNVPVTINVVLNDSDPDGTINPASVVIVGQPTMGGTVVNHGNGTVTFTPFLNFRGTDVFSYRVRDNAGALSNLARVRVNVTR